MLAKGGEEVLLQSRVIIQANIIFILRKSVKTEPIGFLFQGMTVCRTLSYIAASNGRE